MIRVRAEDEHRFKKAGGKIIQFHGSADPLVSPFPMMEYYRSVLDFMGEKNTRAFYKLYVFPGLFHCRGGLGCADDDGIFDALVEWVEQRVEPGGLSARRRPARPAAGFPSGS